MTASVRMMAAAQPDPWLAEVGEHIALVRCARRLTCVQVARAIGVSKSAVSQWEHGKRPMSLAVLRRYAEAIGVQPSELLTTIPGEHGPVAALPRPEPRRRRWRRPGLRSVVADILRAVADRVDGGAFV